MVFFLKTISKNVENIKKYRKGFPTLIFVLVEFSFRTLVLAPEIRKFRSMELMQSIKISITVYFWRNLSISSPLIGREGL